MRIAVLLPICQLHELQKEPHRGSEEVKTVNCMHLQTPPSHPFHYTETYEPSKRARHVTSPNPTTRSHLSVCVDA